MAIQYPDFDDIILLQTYILPIIFDAGAIMSISPYKMDLVGSITSLPEPRTLGGMGYGSPIAGIGIVKWRFHTGETNITIHYHCYHAPNDRAHLLIPQKLFSACVGSTGTFNIGDKCYTLSLDGKQSVQNPYDSKSHLHFSLAGNATASASPTEVYL